MKRAGEITNLSRQVPIALKVNDIQIGKIVLDFVYVTKENRVVFEDVKSDPTVTPLFRWKAKHFAAQYGQRIEVWK